MDPELSRPWSQETPHKAEVALNDLQDLQDACNHSQRDLRKTAFAQAKRFIEQARDGNGVGRISESFPRKNRGNNPTARVDIEVKSGLAFVP